MSLVSAAFFSWLQGAPFYVDLHRQAVELLPAGTGKTWLDAGCGPGLVARLARQRGYAVIGLDRDPAMIHQAERRARGDAGCRFAVSELSRLAVEPPVDVVSAASLLFVVPDAEAALGQLWERVRPGGQLLVIETSERMTPAAARQVKTPPGRRLGLTLWARARNGRAVAPRIFRTLPASSIEHTPLLDGLVSAWVLAKAAT